MDRYNTKKYLEVIGSGGLTFNSSQSWSIVLDNKGFTIYIQTDKGIYKPGQTGKFFVHSFSKSYFLVNCS